MKRFDLSEFRKIVIPEGWFKTNFLGDAIIEDDEENFDEQIKQKNSKSRGIVKPLQRILRHFLFNPKIKIDDIVNINDATESTDNNLELKVDADEKDDFLDDDSEEYLKETPVLKEKKNTCVSKLELVDLYNPVRVQLE